MKTLQCMTEPYEINFVGKLSKQGNKKMVIIPLDKHVMADRLDGAQVYVKIWPVYPDEVNGSDRKVKK